MFKPQYDEYIQIPKKLLQWMYNNLYLLNNFQMYSSTELDKILSYLNSLGLELTSLT